MCSVFDEQVSDVNEELGGHEGRDLSLCKDVVRNSVGEVRS